jgi:hypothetical protein
MDRRDVLLATAAFPVLLEAQTEWKPALFDAHQNATVVALTELIIPATDTPGAKAANVNRYLDLMLNDGPDPQRIAFLEGLGWLDSHARSQHGAPFVRLTPAQQTAILTELDQNKAGLEDGVRFFRMAKGFTARIYYNTQAGYAELNKGGRVPAAIGCPSR